MTYMTLIYCINYKIINTKSWDSSVGPGYTLDDQDTVIQFPGKARTFLFWSAARLTVQSTLPPARWVPEKLFLGVMQPEHEDSMHLHLVLMSKQEYVQLHVQSLYIFTVGA